MLKPKCRFKHSSAVLLCALLVPSLTYATSSEVSWGGRYCQRGGNYCMTIDQWIHDGIEIELLET